MYLLKFFRVKNIQNVYYVSNMAVFGYMSAITVYMLDILHLWVSLKDNGNENFYSLFQFYFTT
jgi:hypothetical protein